MEKNIYLYRIETLKITEMSTLTKKQERDLIKAEKLMTEAKRLFDSVSETQGWCPIKGQTDCGIERALGLLKGFNEFKINN